MIDRRGSLTVQNVGLTPRSSLWSGLATCVVILGLIYGFARIARQRDSAAIVSVYNGFRDALVAGDYARAQRYCRSEFYGTNVYLGTRFDFFRDSDYALHAKHRISFSKGRAYLYPQDYTSGRTWEGAWIIFIKVGTNWYLTGDRMFETD